MSARSEIIRLSLFLAGLICGVVPLQAADNWHATRSGVDHRFPGTSLEVDRSHRGCQSRHAFVGIGVQRCERCGVARSELVLSYRVNQYGCESDVFYWVGPPVCGQWIAPVPWYYSVCLPCSVYPPVFVVPPVLYYDPAAPILRDLGVLRSTMPGAVLNGPGDMRWAETSFDERRPGKPATSDSSPQEAARRDQLERPPTLLPVRVTNSRQRQLAQRFIELGDKLFREGQFRAAYFQYREAEKAAPDVADTYFRQAFALIATRQYPMAFDALKKGLSLDEQWPTRGFRLAMLYGGRDLDARHHRADLALVIEQSPTNAEFLFLLAVHLYCDDRVIEAKEFFRQARTSSSVAPLVSLFPGVD